MVKRQPLLFATGAPFLIPVMATFSDNSFYCVVIRWLQVQIAALRGCDRIGRVSVYFFQLKILFWTNSTKSSPLSYILPLNNIFQRGYYFFSYNLRTNYPQPSFLFVFCILCLYACFFKIDCTDSWFLLIFAQSNTEMSAVQTFSNEVFKKGGELFSTSFIHQTMRETDVLMEVFYLSMANNFLLHMLPFSSKIISHTFSCYCAVYVVISKLLKVP